MKKQLLFLLLSISISAFSQVKFDQDLAERMLALPLKCVHQEYPNKLGQVLNADEDLKTPSVLHPAFYGCFDWHSSVHGHWLMVKLLKQFPDCKQKDSVFNALSKSLTKENILQEIAFFKTVNNSSFERMYGWTWILKLQLELDTWDNSNAKKLTENLRPLSDYLCERYIIFLPKLIYPIRSGEHTNTAFGLCFALDYARHAKKDSLEILIVKRSKELFLSDKKAVLNYEPSGYDFLSPTFEEIDLMRRVLPKTEFEKWLKGFLPEIFKKNFRLTPGKVGDRTDGKLVHLDGLNFSRSWCLSQLAKTNPKLKHLQKIADEHLKFSINNIVDGDYMGEHWLASFATEALLNQ
jgi:hypothetical protein